MGKNIHKTNNITSPLRYPGGKSKALSFLKEHFPAEKQQHVFEPFCGGASVSFYLKQHKYTNGNFCLNDINFNLFNFWNVVKHSCPALVKHLYYMYYYDPRNPGIKRNIGFLKKNFLECKKKLQNPDSPGLERAASYFLLNRCSYAGLTEAGNFSPTAAKDRYTDKSINKLEQVSLFLRQNNIVLTTLDYKEILKEAANIPKHENVFIFLDPPYDILQNKTSGIYGPNGQTHTSFDHFEFANFMDGYIKTISPNIKIMITYNNSDKLRGLFSNKNWNHTEWELTYSFHRNKNPDKQKETKRKGKELLLTNY